MTTREVLSAILLTAGKSQADVAAMMGWSPQSLSQRLVRDTLRSDDFLKIVELLGIEVTFTVKDSGKIVKIRNAGHGRRLRKMSDRVIFDTTRADAISNSFYADGTNEYDENGEAQELYIDDEGRYFVAEYHTDASKDKIRAVPASLAVAFIEKYGTTIEKKTE